MRTEMGFEITEPGLVKKIDEFHSFSFSDLLSMAEFAEKNMALHSSGPHNDLLQMWNTRRDRIRDEIDRRFGVIDAIDDFCRRSRLRHL